MSDASFETAPVIDAAFRGQLGEFALDLAFSLGERGVTALFGPSGSGKTTVLRCIAGLARMDGTLRVDGTIWQDSARGIFIPPHRRSVGYVFQEPSLFPHLSVRRNLLFGAARRPAGGGPDALAFDDVVALLGCAPLLDRAVGALSGGESQRVAIGRALLAQPRLLLMDEPLSALDRATRDDFLGYLDRLQRELSIPILYVSHDIGEVSQLADRIVVLSEGRNVTEGPVGPVLERLDLEPHTGRFEAGVVLTARVTGEDTKYDLTALDVAGQAMTVPRFDASIGDTVRLRIRARDVVLATEKPKAVSIRNIFAGTVSELRADPETAYAEALIDIGGARIRARITRASADELALAPGKDVFCLVKSISFDGRTLRGTPANPPSRD